MKLTASLLLLPMALLATASPAAQTATDLVGLSSDGKSLEHYPAVEYRAGNKAPLAFNVPATVTAQAVDYYDCARTTCRRGGTYIEGQAVTIYCYLHGETYPPGLTEWARLTNGWYVPLLSLYWPGLLSRC